MKRIWGIAVAMGIVGSGISQTPPDQRRVDMIWNHAVDRLNRQTDTWFDDGDFPRVINICRVMYALYPEDFEMATNLGWMLENIELWDQALAVYIQYRTENPNDPDAPYPEANFYFRRKVFPKVPPLLEPSLKMATKPHPNSFRVLAHAYEKMDLLADSQRIWKSMLTAYPDDRPAKSNLARVEKKLRGDGK